MSSVVGRDFRKGTEMAFTTKVIVGCGGLLLSLMGATGVASAQPDVIANSTCSYGQVMAALNAQNPAVANELSSSPVATAWLQSLIASPPDQRRVMYNQALGYPGVAQYAGLINSVAASCNGY